MTEHLPARAEHLHWCKRRALEYVDRGELSLAIASMLSDLSKHPETHCNCFLAEVGFLEAQRGADAVRRWIDGF